MTEQTPSPEHLAVAVVAIAETLGSLIGALRAFGVMSDAQVEAVFSAAMHRPQASADPMQFARMVDAMRSVADHVRAPRKPE